MHNIDSKNILQIIPSSILYFFLVSKLKPNCTYVAHWPTSGDLQQSKSRSQWHWFRLSHIWTCQGSIWVWHALCGLAWPPTTSIQVPWRLLHAWSSWSRPIKIRFRVARLRLALPDLWSGPVKGRFESDRLPRRSLDLRSSSSSLCVWLLVWECDYVVCYLWHVKWIPLG